MPRNEARCCASRQSVIVPHDIVGAPEDPDLPPSARFSMQAMERIACTAEDYTRRGIGFGQRLIRAPLVQNHVVGVQAHVIASETTRGSHYTPYTHFRPHVYVSEDHCAPTSSTADDETSPEGGNVSQSSPPSSHPPPSSAPTSRIQSPVPLIPGPPLLEHTHFQTDPITMDNPDPECPQMGSNLTSQSQMPSAIVISQSNGDCMNQDPPPDINLTPQSQIPLVPSAALFRTPDILYQATVTSQRSIDHRDLNPPLSPPTSAPLGDPIRTYQTVIDQAIAEHLEAATMGLVEPTVRGIIDACVPHLTEFIESRFVTLTPSRLNPPCKAHQCCSAPHEEDYDGDNDHDTGEDAVQKQIIPSGPKAELPASALVDAVRTFNQDGISPLLLENVVLDWHCSPLTSSRWNSEAISILSLDFYNNLHIRSPLMGPLNSPRRVPLVGNYSI
ncbi:hypothetical protein HD554DRAFT_2036989 [Boletus coccyginus]|nr:hypothetical protein HD554DRAFT_2036989 [Boletus coccyginus]